MTVPPGLLICAGIDPSGGAGLIADVRIAAMLDTRPVGVATAVTIQNTTAVMGSAALDPDTVRAQLEMLLSDVEVRAVKIGMVGSSAVARAIGEALALTAAPVVWDPVAYASRGDVALVEGTLDRALDALAPHLTILTPNARELAMLACADVRDAAEAVAAGQMLSQRLGCAVLVKGGHIDHPRRGSATVVSPSPATADQRPPSPPSSEDPSQTREGWTAPAEPAPDDTRESVIDYLCQASGVIEITGPRTPGGENVHGTGCALSTALAAHLALGSELVEACQEAKRFVAELISAPVAPGRGASAVV